MPSVRSPHWLSSLAPALLAGAHLTGLLFFLTPDHPISLAALARGTAYYGLLFAAPSVAVHLLLARLVHVPVARLLPWTAALTMRDGKPAGYFCRNFACEAPTTSAEELASQLDARPS